MGRKGSRQGVESETLASRRYLSIEHESLGFLSRKAHNSEKNNRMDLILEHASVFVEVEAELRDLMIFETEKL
jgi:hypothetical protein